MTEIEKSYLAGWIDGEGSIVIFKRGTNPSYRKTMAYNMRLTATNTDYQVIEWIHQRCGGNICEYPPARGRSRAWKWSTSCQIAERILTDIFPYLITKKAEARVALEFQRRVFMWKTQFGHAKGRRGQMRISTEELARRDELANQLLTIRAARLQR